jgi:hypothetical protein
MQPETDTEYHLSRIKEARGADSDEENVMKYKGV